MALVFSYQSYGCHTPASGGHFDERSRDNNEMDETKMNTQKHTPTQVVPKERRRNQALRQHFETARDLLRPLLGSPDNHNGAAYYRAMHKLQATFPDLSVSEIEALVAAVVRSVQTRNGGK
jgi:hypothetical protein